MKVLLILLLFTFTLQWWQVGHMLVSKIAQNDLKKVDPTSYAKFNEIILALNQFTDGRSSTFTQAAVWADDIKTYGATLFDNYHYLDRIYDPQGIMPIMSQVNRNINSLNTIGWCLSILKKNMNTISFQRALMARFLLHIVGDIHQPLHSVAMYNSSKQLINGDDGGNKLNITTVDGVTYNLHAFLDSIAAVIQKYNETTVERPLNQIGTSYIQSLAQQITNTYTKQSFGNLVQITDINTWTLESYNEAVTYLYSYVQKNNKASAEWTDTVFQLCKKKIALAGFRLSNIISSIYK